MRILCLILLGVLAGCTAQSPDPAYNLPPPAVHSNDNSRELSAAERKIVSAYVAKQMRDPESAKFEWARISSAQNGTVYYCSLVNGKNAYGGYTGMAPYIATLQISNGKVTAITHVMLGGSGPATSDVRTECRRRNVPDPVT
jgi:hypothetical protein